MRNYIFISYAHKDSERVWPVIQKLRESGYNVWYDDGIDPGTEWAANIATHIEGCACFIAFMSQAYLDSLNCREEWDFAREEQKLRFLVYIEDVKLPSEIRLRSGMIQNLFMHKYNDKEEFYSKLFAAPGIEVCKNTEFDISERSAHAEEKKGENAEALGRLKENSLPGEAWETYFEIEESEDGITIRKCISDAAEIVIPEKIKGKTVTYIGEIAFFGCTSLSSVSIPEGVTRIGSCAFGRCTSLSSVSMPEGVTRIGNDAFHGCTSLSSVSIPEGVSVIEGSVFAGCTSLSSVSIPEGVTAIWNEAFAGCTSLSSVSIPEGVTEIEKRTFAGCTSLSSVSIPEGVTEIGCCAFSGCTSLLSITIPDSVIEIGIRAFFRCKRLANIVIPKGIKHIGPEAFRGCRRLKYMEYLGTDKFQKVVIGKITLSFDVNPSYIYYLFEEMFLHKINEYRQKVKEMPDGVVAVGSRAFAGCSWSAIRWVKKQWREN